MHARARTVVSLTPHTAYIVMAYIVMAYIVMARTVVSLMPHIARKFIGDAGPRLYPLCGEPTT